MNIQLILAGLQPQQGSTNAGAASEAASGSASFAAILGQVIQPNQDALAALQTNTRALPLPQTGLVLQTVLGNAGKLSQPLSIEDLEVPALEEGVSAADLKIVPATDDGSVTEHALVAIQPEAVMQPATAQVTGNAPAADDVALRQNPGVVLENAVAQPQRTQTANSQPGSPALNVEAPLETPELAAKSASTSTTETNALQQLASNSQSLSAGSVARPILTAPLASPQWQNDLSQQVSSLVLRGDGRVSLQLNPADLGPLLVELKITEQSAQLQFVSGQAAVRSAVEQAIPQLRDALAEQGINLGDVNVGEQTRQQEQFLAQRGAASVSADEEVEAAELVSGEGTSAASALPGQLSIYV